jgi:hypothetical protein
MRPETMNEYPPPPVLGVPYRRPPARPSRPIQLQCEKILHRSNRTKNKMGNSILNPFLKRTNNPKPRKTTRRKSHPKARNSARTHPAHARSCSKYRSNLTQKPAPPSRAPPLPGTKPPRTGAAIGSTLDPPTRLCDPIVGRRKDGGVRHPQQSDGSALPEPFAPRRCWSRFVSSCCSNRSQSARGPFGRSPGRSTTCRAHQRLIRLAICALYSEFARAKRVQPEISMGVKR